MALRHLPHSLPQLNGSSSQPPANPLVSPTAGPSSQNGVGPPPPSGIIQKLNSANEQTWLLIGRVAEQMGDLEHALSAYENALRHNPMSLSGLTQVAGIARIKENYPKAVEFFQRVLSLQEENGEVWSALGHCYLMQDDLQKAYSAYQQALYLLPNPKEDPKLWYGIGILYDRYGSLDHAEEAFSSVLRMDKDFDKANEILFRLGIIYKQQGKYEESLACFDRILRNPPSPLAHADIWFQIGHVYEQQKDHVRAKDAYERVVADNPGHAKVLQQLGWLYHQDGSTFQNQDMAIQYLTKSLEADPSDAQSWYLLGRAYMAGQKYNKAYEAYQQAVYRDGRNPTFWCSIGVLYFQINQFRDALDAYSRAIRINPYISEVWFDLGSLYESCNNQISDAIDAYARASELDPTNTQISSRLQLLKNAQATGSQLPAAPGPQDVHPTAYASAVVPPPGFSGPPLLLQSGSSAPGSSSRLAFRADSNGGEISLPPPSQVTAGLGPGGRGSSPPFGGRPPPPVILDDSRHQSHMLAPMDVDRPPREYPGIPGSGRSDRDNRERSERGGSGLLHHPIPQLQNPPDDIVGSGRTNGHGHSHHPSTESFFTRGPNRPSSRSVSPAPHHHLSSRNGRTSTAPYPPLYPGSNSSSTNNGRQPISPAVSNSLPPPPIRSPRNYPETLGMGRPASHDAPWDDRARDRRGPPPALDHNNTLPPPRDWEEKDRERDRERERMEREKERDRMDSRRPQHRLSSGDNYPTLPPPSAGSSYPKSRSPAPGMGRASPPELSPRSAHPSASSSRYWENKPNLPSMRRPSPSPHESARSRYDPPPMSMDGMRSTERRGSDSRSYAGSPEGMHRNVPSRNNTGPSIIPPPLPAPTPISHSSSQRISGPGRSSESPHPSSNQSSEGSSSKKSRGGGKRSRRKEDDMDNRPPPPLYKPYDPKERDHGSPAPMGSSSNSSGRGRSVQPSPTGTHSNIKPPMRVLDDDYDEPGVADALMGLAGYRPGPLGPGPAGPGVPSSSGPSSDRMDVDPVHSPTMSSGAASRRSLDHPSPRQGGGRHRHHDSTSSTRSHPPATPSPPTGTNSGVKRPLSPSPDMDNKRSRTEYKRGPSPPNSGRRTSLPSSRPSPIPFVQQPSTHSPPAENSRAGPGFNPPSPPSSVVLPSQNSVLPPPSPPLAVVLPPHPRPIGVGRDTGSSTGGNSNLALPPIATLSPDSDSSERGRERERERGPPSSGPRRDSPRIEKRSPSPPRSVPPPSASSGGRRSLSHTPPKHSPGSAGGPGSPYEKKEQ